MLILCVILFACKAEKKPQKELLVYDFNQLEANVLNNEDDKTYVINFWATWCAPCVKELPYFEQLNAEYHDKNVEVVLVSLDFPKLFESKLKPFIVKNDLQSQVIALRLIKSGLVQYLQL